MKFCSCSFKKAVLVEAIQMSNIHLHFHIFLNVNRIRTAFFLLHLCLNYGCQSLWLVALTTHPVMSLCVGWTERCQDHMLHSGNRAEHKEGAQCCIMVLLRPTRCPPTAKTHLKAMQFFLRGLCLSLNASEMVRCLGRTQLETHLDEWRSVETWLRSTQPLTS